MQTRRASRADLARGMILTACALALAGCHARHLSRTAPDAVMPRAEAALAKGDTSSSAREPTTPRAPTTSSSASPSGSGAPAPEVAAPRSAAPASSAAAMEPIASAGVAIGGTSRSEGPRDDARGDVIEKPTRVPRTPDDQTSTAVDSARESAPPSEPESHDEQRKPPYPALVWIAARPNAVRVGERVAIDVHVADARGIKGVPFHLRYDARVLAFRAAEEGGFLASAGRDTAFLASLLDAGRIAVGASLLGPGEGASGSGLIATLVFEAIGVGPARLEFERASAHGASTGTVFSGAMIVVGP